MSKRGPPSGGPRFGHWGRLLQDHDPVEVDLRAAGGANQLDHELMALVGLEPGREGHDPAEGTLLSQVDTAHVLVVDPDVGLAAVGAHRPDPAHAPTREREGEPGAGLGGDSDLATLGL